MLLKMAKFHSFLCLSNISQSKYVISSLSIPLLIHIWVSYNLTIVNNVAMNISSVQFRSVAQSCPNFCNPMDCSMPSLPVRHQLLQLLKLMSIESVMPYNHLILCHPLLPPSIFPNIRVFSVNIGVHISFQFSIFVFFGKIPRSRIDISW